MRAIVRSLTRVSLAGPLAGRGAAGARALSSLRKMEVGSEPQVSVTAQGVHRPGVLRDLTAHLLENGVSIAGSKKIMLNDSFAVLLSLWVPPDQKSPAEMVTAINNKAGALMGFSVEARLIDQAAVKAQSSTPVLRHLKLTCPQKPGIIKAISELLKVRAAMHVCRPSAPHMLVCGAPTRTTAAR